MSKDYRGRFEYGRPGKNKVEIPVERRHLYPTIFPPATEPSTLTRQIRERADAWAHVTHARKQKRRVKDMHKKRYWAEMEEAALEDYNSCG